MYENLWNSVENSMKIYGNLRKSRKIYENLRKSMKIYENLWQSMACVGLMWAHKQERHTLFKRFFKQTIWNLSILFLFDRSHLLAPVARPLMGVEGARDRAPGFATHRPNILGMFENFGHLCVPFFRGRVSSALGPSVGRLASNTWSN